MAPAMVTATVVVAAVGPVVQSRESSNVNSHNGNHNDYKTAY